MTEQELDRLAREASRDDYRSMARLARALYESGLGERRVVHRCYGVDFPDEFFAIAEAGGRKIKLPVFFMNQPWQMAVPLERGGPDPEPDSAEEIERQVLVMDPGLLPLMLLEDPEPVHGDGLLCYRLDELRAGRTTIIGFRYDCEPSPQPTKYGDSLLAVLHEHFSDGVKRVEWEIQQPFNRGAGSADESDVNMARRWFERVEEIERQLAARAG